MTWLFELDGIQRTQLTQAGKMPTGSNHGVLVWLALCCMVASCGLGCTGKKERDAASETAKDSLPESDSEDATFSFAPVKDAPDSSAQTFGDTRGSQGVRFIESHETMGLLHTYQNGAQGQALISETIGGGCGWLDYDRDGRPDLFLNQGGNAAEGGSPTQPADALFQNRIRDNRIQMANVAGLARVQDHFYSQGVCIGDYNNDGWQDIYVTNLGPNTLWINCGDGTFLECAAQAQVGDSQWGTSAAWCDLDLDGDLDLYVCNYCEFDPASPVPCLDREGRPTVCNPAKLDDQADVCYINLGNGLFEEQGRERGLFGEGNRALGVAAADFTNDGWPDLYVANDTTANYLFVNDGTGHFEDEATLRGCAVDRAGGPQGSMGLAVADVDSNGFLDIYSTHFFEESNTLYLNFGDLGFRDQTALSGLHQPTLDFLGFGTVIEDFDADGLLELVIANGHVDHSARAPQPQMKPQIFSQDRRGRWHSIAETAGDYFGKQFMGRGIAAADVDLDGDVDLAFVNENDPAVLLENVASPLGDWLQLDLIGRSANRDGIGARVTVSWGESSHARELVGGSSFASTHDSRLFIPLGNEAAPAEIDVQIHWPGGTQSQRLRLPKNTASIISEQTP